MLQAPAGYGKTVLAAQVQASEPDRTAWLYLEPEDADPRRFCRYLAGALREVLPALAGTEITKPANGGEFDPDAWVEDLLLFFHEFHSSRVRLVLDNFESVADEPVVNRVVDRLLRHAGEAMSLLITTRSDPGFPLQKLVERKEALKLTARNLAFDLDEFKSAARAQGKKIPPTDLESVWAQSEGWCVYLGLGLGTGPEARPLSPASSGITGYLEEEILRRMPENQARVLRDTCVLDVVSAEGMDALGLNGENFHEQVLELGRRGIPHLTVMEGEAVRLHPLVRGKLLQDLRQSPPTEGKRNLLDRASGFYRSRGRSDAAVRILLELEAYEPALETLSASWVELEEQQLLPQVAGWLEMLPHGYRSHPLFALSRLRVLRFEGENLEIDRIREPSARRGNPDRRFPGLPSAVDPRGLGPDPSRQRQLRGAPGGMGAAPGTARPRKPALGRIHPHRGRPVRPEVRRGG